MMICARLRVVYEYVCVCLMKSRMIRIGTLNHNQQVLLV